VGLSVPSDVPVLDSWVVRALDGEHWTVVVVEVQKLALVGVVVLGE